MAGYPITLDDFDPNRFEYGGITVPFAIRNLIINPLVLDESDEYEVNGADDLETGTAVTSPATIPLSEWTRRTSMPPSGIRALSSYAMLKRFWHMQKPLRNWDAVQTRCSAGP